MITLVMLSVIGWERSLVVVRVNCCLLLYCGIISDGIGCYMAHTTPGLLISCGADMRRSEGRLFFAGTETATEWAGIISVLILCALITHRVYGRCIAVR